MRFIDIIQLYGIIDGERADQRTADLGDACAAPQVLPHILSHLADIGAL